MTRSMSVQVKETPVRTTPSFLSPVITPIPYGAEVLVLGEARGWMEVDARGTRGFVHGSALTPKKVILNPGTADVRKAASSDEYALAGKGFNAQVEGEFRKSNPRLNFRAVNQMEGYGIPPDQIRVFMSQGGIVPKGGG